MTPILAAIALTPLINLLLAVVVALIVIYCVSLFIADGKIMTVIRLLAGLIVLIYGLKLFGIAV